MHTLETNFGAKYGPRGPSRAIYEPGGPGGRRDTYCIERVKHYSTHWGKCWIHLICWEISSQCPINCQIQFQVVTMRYRPFYHILLDYYYAVENFLPYSSGLPYSSVRNKASPSDNDWLKLLRSKWFENLSDIYLDQFPYHIILGLAKNILVLWSVYLIMSLPKKYDSGFCETECDFEYSLIWQMIITYTGKYVHEYYKYRMSKIYNIKSGSGKSNSPLP